MGTKIYLISLFLLMSYQIFALSICSDTCQEVINYHEYKITKITRLNSKTFRIDISDALDNKMIVLPIISIKEGRCNHCMRIKEGKIYKMKLINYYFIENNLNYASPLIYNPLLQGKKKVSVESIDGIFLTQNLNGLYFIDSNAVINNSDERKKVRDFTYNFIKSIYSSNDFLFLSMLNCRKVKKSIKPHLRFIKKRKPKLKLNSFKLNKLFFNIYFPKQKEYLKQNSVSVLILHSAQRITTVRIDWNIIMSNKVRKIIFPQSMVIAIETKNSNFKIIGVDLPLPDILFYPYSFFSLPPAPKQKRTISRDYKSR